MTARRGVALLGLAALVVLAGCQGVSLPPRDTTAPPGGDHPDPGHDVVGWEDGYWYNDSVAVDQSDGLNDTEMQAYVARAMARVEEIRDREFESSVPVEVISRSEYRNGSGGSNDESYDAWNNQVWEAALVVGEDEDVGEILHSTLGNSVLGFYSPTDDEIKIITPTPERPTISNTTLIHELTHAMQDQYEDLTAPRFGGATQDADLATDGLVEGEARFVERRYVERCGASWSCVATPPDEGGGGGPPPNFGVSVTLYFPYSDGPVYVAALHDRGGWDAVDRAFDDPPASSEQVIHVTDEEPVEVRVADTASDGWRRFDQGADTLGEASIFAGLWYQAYAYGADTVDWRAIRDADGPLDTYNYNATPSAGWAGDAVVPYRNGDERGYVYETRWDSATDAAQFQAAYLDALAAHDARQVDDRTWVVDDGPFADAFRVVRRNDTVTVVNAPTVEELSAVHDLDAASDPPATDATSADGGVPGLGLAGAFAAALAALAVAMRRS